MREVIATSLLLAATVPVMACAQAPSGQATATYSLADASQGARLRSEIGVVLSSVLNPCGTSTGLSAALKNYNALRTSQAGTPREVDFAIARADYDYEMSLVDIACPELNAEQQAEADELEAAVANTVMGRIDILLAELAERGE